MKNKTKRDRLVIGKDSQKDNRKFKIVKTRQEQDNNKIYGQHFVHTN